MNKGKESLFSTVEKCSSILLGFFFLSKNLFDFGQSCSSPLRILKQSSNQTLHLRTGELQSQRTFTVSPPMETNQRQVRQPHTKEKRYSKIVRSSSQRLLMVPQSHFKTRGDKSFRTVAPSSFKKQLKIHLFRLVFN